MNRYWLSPAAFLMLPFLACSSGEVEAVTNAPDAGAHIVDGSHALDADSGETSTSSEAGEEAGEAGESCAAEGGVAYSDAGQISLLRVTPGCASVMANHHAQFEALLQYADGTKKSATTVVSWSSSVASVATVGAATGIAAGVAAGTSVITASYEGLSAAVTLTVTPQHVTCVDPVVGNGCSPGVDMPCSQPANPCVDGYIWSCDPATSAWYHELIQCFTDATGTTKTTAACAADQVLFVDDAAGDMCHSTEDGGAPDAGGCPAGEYLFEPGCCYFATNAYCVATPAACDGNVSCGCTQAFCETECGGGSDPGVSCSNATQSVVDCLCGKV